MSDNPVVPVSVALTCFDFRLLFTVHVQYIRSYSTVLTRVAWSEVPAKAGSRVITAAHWWRFDKLEVAQDLSGAQKTQMAGKIE